MNEYNLRFKTLTNQKEGKSVNFSEKNMRNEISGFRAFIPET